VGFRAFTHLSARAVVAMVVLCLPQAAGAQESAAAGTVYDKALYESLVREGTARDEARCASALAGAVVKLERRNRDGYFLPVDADDPSITPNVNPQRTDEDGTYYWEAAEGDYRVSVTKTGYWRLFSSTVSATSAVMNLDLPLKRRPGTPPPKPRDCSSVDEPEPQPEPQPEPDPAEPEDHEPQSNDPETEPKSTCMFRPVNARVSGRLIAKVVFTLDGRHFITVRRPDDDGRFGVTVDRESLSHGRHVLRAKVVFVRQANRSPEFLRLAFRRCPERTTPKAVQAGPAAKCGTRPFLAWVRGARIRRVQFRLDGRKLRSVSAADWRGRYGVTVRPGRLREGRHVVTAQIEFLRGSGLKQRTVRLSFRKCT
jgi:hypothetical protein